MIIMDSTALDCPLVDELLALLAVLEGTMQCIQGLNLKHRDASDDQAIQPDQLSGLSQQLSQLHIVGLQLSARWEGFKDESDCKTEFVQSLACEVRNLVSIVLNTSGVLQRHGTTLEPERRQIIFARIQTAIHELASLLKEATTLHGMTDLRHELQLTHVDVELLCERIVREKKAANPNRRIRLGRKGDTRLEQIDETWLRQTLYKVLDNAIAYSPDNSVVNLKVVWTESELAIQIKDMGMGIPEEELAEVCKPFYRAGNARSISGMGLGLALAFQAMQLQQGFLEITSQVGKGTTVTLHFPCNRELPNVSGSVAQVHNFHYLSGN